MVGEKKARGRSEEFKSCRDGAGCNPNLRLLKDDNSAGMGEEGTDRARGRVSIR
jgi:hypothetical protein